MNIKRATALTKRYARCQECGCDRVGNGEGGLYVDDEAFLRICKCGWSVKVDDFFPELLSAAESFTEAVLMQTEKERGYPLPVNKLGAIITRLNRQLDVADEYAKRNRDSTYASNLWEIQNDHLREIAQELQAVISEEGGNEWVKSASSG